MLRYTKHTIFIAAIGTIITCVKCSAQLAPAATKASPATRPVFLQVHDERDDYNGRLVKRWTSITNEHGEEVKEGYEITFNPNGSIFQEVPYRHGVIDGHVRRYYPPDGETPQADEFWVEGKREGTWTEWHPNGMPYRRTEHSNGVPTFEDTYDDMPKGTKLSSMTFDKRGNLQERTEFHLDGSKFYHASY